MTIADLENFERLCDAHGIVAAYYDIRGVHHVASVEARSALLQAMGVACASDAEVSASLDAERRRHWQGMTAPVTVVREADAPRKISLNLAAPRLGQPLHWRISGEDGTALDGSWQFDAHAAVDGIELDGEKFCRFDAELPHDIGTGYHRLTLQIGDEMAESLLIVAPATCYLPEAIEAGERPWGVSLQLYALRSRRNWGIGDFTDLQSAIETFAPLGVDAIGLNPLHALFAHLPENASPYSPSSRDFINPVYLDIDAIAKHDGCEELARLIGSDSFRSRLQALRERPRVDYSGVWAAKLEALEILYRQFRRGLDNEDSDRARRFRAYQHERDHELRRFALFEALRAFFHGQDPGLETWQQWPAEFRDPDSAAVADWAAAHLEQIEFHEYLQWQADEQLASARRQSERLGMQIGLYNDLAVGDERFSAQCWMNPALYAADTGVGAPPDDFSPRGQNWGLPPQIPRQLADMAYEPFIRSLRANMRHAGALRIDHVMGLMRLYWVPAGCAADAGTYVGYPFDDLLAIVALESHRNRCLVIGEDLGTVPNEVRHALWVNKILSYRILLFEKDWDNGSFRAPVEYPELALCASGSHDLPTLRGYWRGADLELREKLELYPYAEMAQQQRDLRGQDRHELIAALLRENLVSESQAEQLATGTEAGTELLLAVQRFLARSPACLMMLQLEDMLWQAEQVNLPGTVEEYPNWRNKVSLALEDWHAEGGIESIARAVGAERSARQ